MLSDFHRKQVRDFKVGDQVILFDFPVGEVREVVEVHPPEADIRTWSHINARGEDLQEQTDAVYLTYPCRSFDAKE